MMFAYEVQFIPSDYVEYTNSEEGIISAPSLSEALNVIGETISHPSNFLILKVRQ